MYYGREYVEDGVPKCEIRVRIPSHPSCPTFQTWYHIAYGRELRSLLEGSTQGTYRVLSDF